MITLLEHLDQVYGLHQSNGTVYKFSSDGYLDDTNPIKVLIQTSRYDGDTVKLKFINRLEIVGDWQDTTSDLTVYWSDDDYKTWSSGRVVDLVSRPYLYRCGSFRRRAFRLYHEDATPFRLNSLELDLKVGVH